MFLAIVDTIRQRFVTRGFTQITVDDGIEARNAQTNFGMGGANRVVFVPAPDPLAFAPPKYIGEGDADGSSNARRQLWTTSFVFEVAIAAHDPDQPERDLAHRHACFDLFEIVAQEVHLAYSGQYEWTSARWDNERKHGRFGAELVATLVMNIPIFDAPSGVVSPSGVLGNPVEKAP